MKKRLWPPGISIRSVDGDGLGQLGGFQSGFHACVLPRAEARWPAYLVCQHDCATVVQLISHVSGEPEFELCAIEAERMGKVLLDAARQASFGDARAARQDG